MNSIINLYFIFCSINTVIILGVTITDYYKTNNITFSIALLTIQAMFILSSLFGFILLVMVLTLKKFKNRRRSKWFFKIRKII